MGFFGNTGRWKAQLTDNFDMKTLLAYKKFFESDLALAIKYRDSIKKYDKIPSFKQIYGRANEDIKISEYNLKQCDALITANKAKGR
jgi:hypothetical protein